MYTIIRSSAGLSEVVARLLDQGGSIDAQYTLVEFSRLDHGEPRTALAAASRFGHYEVAQLLLDRGADVDACSALRAAISCKHHDITQLLLDHNANVNFVGRITTPLKYACQNNDKHLVQMLIAKGANINLESDLGDPPLSIAIDGGNTDIMCLLLGNGADVNLQGGHNRYNALHTAASKCQYDLIPILRKHGANINACSRFGTALAMAVDNGHEQVVQVLLELGAGVNADVQEDGSQVRRPLSAAASKGDEPMVRRLLDAGAEVNYYYGGVLYSPAFEDADEPRVKQILRDRGAILARSDAFPESEFPDWGLVSEARFPTHMLKNMREGYDRNRLDKEI